MLLSFSEIIVVIFRNEMKDSHGLGRSISADAHEFAEKGREIIKKKKKTTKNEEEREEKNIVRRAASQNRRIGGRKR